MPKLRTRDGSKWGWYDANTSETYVVDEEYVDTTDYYNNGKPKKEKRYIFRKHYPKAKLTFANAKHRSLFIKQERVTESVEAGCFTAYLKTALGRDYGYDLRESKEAVCVLKPETLSPMFESFTECKNFGNEYLEKHFGKGGSR